MIFAIDPGNRESGWVIYSGAVVIDGGVSTNAGVLDLLRRPTSIDGMDLAIEKFEARGMAMGQESIDTMVWAGRFQQAWHDPEAVHMVYRRDVKLHLCGSAKANDTNVRKALIDLFPATGGGKVPQIGIKARPGPLFGISSHTWAALAVAVTVKGAP